MSKFKVALLDHGYPTIRYEQQVISEAGGAVLDTQGLSTSEALRLCQEADAILVRWFKVTADFLRPLRRCRIIVRYGVGTDNVDAEAATQAGVMVGHVPHYCVEEVSTHAIALLLSCVRNLAATQQKMTQGGWDVNPAHTLWRMAGRTLGLVGLGNIGQAVARKLSGWGLRMIATDPYLEIEQADALGIRLVELDQLCREADYISLHVPLLPETCHLLGQRQFALMKAGLILINTARGRVLDSQSLLGAIAEGKIARAGLDVFEEEPLPTDSPLRTHPRILLSDHIAWYSEESQVELQQTAAEEAVRVCLGGLPRSLVNPEVLHRLGRYGEWEANPTARWQLKRLQKLGRYLS